MSDGELLILGLFAASFIPPLLSPLAYRRAERRSRMAWADVALPPFVASEGAAYRAPRPIAMGHLDRAPGLVRLAAGSSIVLGSMFVPGLALGLFGLFAGGIGLVSIPGLFVAASLWGVGHQLLRRQKAERAVSIATWSLIMNVIILAAVAVMVLSTSESAFWILGGGTAAYACLSIGHALVLRKAGRLVAALSDPERADEPYYWAQQTGSLTQAFPART